MSTTPCHGTDYGYICHLGAHCARVTPDATIEHRMLCEHLTFPHFRSHPGTTLQREAVRFFEPEPPAPSPGAALAAAWKPTPQMELFA